MQRFPDWPVRLEAFLLANQARAFEWGKWDCSLFVADAIHEMTGLDPALRLRDSYATYRGALTACLSICGTRSAEDCAVRLLIDAGARPIPPAQARRGDALLLAEGRRRQIGLVALDGHDALIASKRGLMRYPLLSAVAAWAI